jgi:hypothetical protein
MIIGLGVIQIKNKYFNFITKKRGCIYSKEGFVVVSSQDKSLLQNIKSQFFKSNKSQELTAGKMQVIVFEV